MQLLKQLVMTGLLRSPKQHGLVYFGNPFAKPEYRDLLNIPDRLLLIRPLQRHVLHR